MEKPVCWLNPGSADSLAEAIAKLARDESMRRDFGQAGRRRIEQNFIIEKTIEPLLERFERALSS